ncbi:MAG TPA: cytochrome c maturation protein CcmE [Bacteroidia bacterium]|nr:cytochrome c maturation protein CcmE [Bacteroidia bacterium]
MKKSHIIGIILIAIAIAAIFASLGDASTYATLSEAKAKAGKEFHVVGKLDKSKEMIYNPEQDPNMFTFYMKDGDSTLTKVILHQAKPQDFEHTEQIVAIGKWNGTDFEASSVLMKCPSKYVDGKKEVNS